MQREIMVIGATESQLQLHRVIAGISNSICESRPVKNDNLALFGMCKTMEDLSNTTYKFNHRQNEVRCVQRFARMFEFSTF